MNSRPQRSFSFALLGALLAAFAVLTATAIAGSGTGSSFNLGKTNSVSRQSVLTGSAGRAAQLKVRNKGRGPALEAVVRRGVPPFKVNSSGKVANLNADLLDGIHGAGYQRRVTGSCAAGTAIRVVNADGSVTCQLIGSAFWSLNGNAATNAAANFLGTTDAQPLILKTNNAEALRVDAGGNVGIGTTSPEAKVHASASTGTGVAATSDSGIGIAAGSSSAQGVIGHSTTAVGVEGSSKSGTGVSGEGPVAGVRGHSAGRGGIGVHASSNQGTGVFATTGSTGEMAVHGDSSATRGVVGTLGGVSCAGSFAVGGCGGSSGNGVFGDSTGGIGVWGRSTTRGVVGTLGGTSCAGTYGVGGCAPGAGQMGVLGRSDEGFGVYAETSTGTIFAGSGGGTQQVRIDATGKGFFNGGTQNSGADYAESLRAGGDAAALEPGDVLAIDARGGPAVRKSRAPNSPLLAGVYSTKPAVLAVGDHGINDSLEAEVPVALLGVVPTKVSAENGAIRPGDLLVSARTPGHAMRAKPLILRGVKIYPTGSILGKALQSLRKGKGKIKVLVMLR